MKIAIFGINYTPELTGIGKYTGEMGAWFASQGHDVYVITAMPYYPEWSIHKKYKSRWWHREVIEGVTVQRCPIYVPKNITSLKRIIHEFSFIAAAFPIWLMMLFKKKYDVVICISPPFHLGFLPLLYSKIRRTVMITHIQDLQVDAAKNLLMLKKGRFLNMLFGAEKFILKRSTFVSTISYGMIKKIKEKGLPNMKTIYFPNWVDEKLIVPLPKELSLRREFGLSDEDKVILYSGNLGQKQGLEIIMSVAKEFAKRSDIIFLIVGNGENKKKLEDLASNDNLKNVRFYPLVPKEKMSALLATADIHLVLQRKSASDLMMPSKLSGILSAGGFPIVTALPGTSLFDLVNNNNLGFLIKPESSFALKKGIEIALESDLETYKQNSRHYAIAYLSIEWIMTNFERELYDALPTKIKFPVIYNQTSPRPKSENQTYENAITSVSKGI